MKVAALPLLVAAALTSCSTERGPTHQMFPECTQATPEQQRARRCVERPDPPGDMSN